MEPFFAGTQGTLRGALQPPACCFRQLAFNGGGEPGQVLLRHIIVSSRAHGGNRRGLAHRSRHHDEGDIAASLLKQVQRLGCGKERQVVIGQNAVPGLAQGGKHKLRRLHPLRLHNEAGAVQMPLEQGSIVCIVFHHQQTQRSALRTRLRPV